jgi:hypothetical protein
VTGQPVLWRALIWATAVVGGILAAACSDAARTSGAGSSTSGVHALHVSDAAVPPFAQPGISVSGSAPHFSDDADLAQVNALIDDAIRADERIEVPSPSTTSNSESLGSSTVVATYDVNADRSLMAASTGTVSVLLDVHFMNAAGAHGYAIWVAVTIDVQAGRRVELNDLLSEPTSAASELAAAVRDQLLANAGDCRGSIAAWFSSASPSDVARLFSTFALNTSGLLVGVSEGEIASPACGRMLATLPWDTVRPLLNDVGVRMVDAIRTPAEP